MVFLVHPQSFHFQNYTADEAAIATECIVARSAVRRSPSDFSNEAAPSAIVQWPVFAFLVLLLASFKKKKKYHLQCYRIVCRHNSPIY